MRDFHDLYMKSDVLLLADVFENFRNVCMKYYGLDQVYYYTTPSLAWDAMLKMTKVKLELLTDHDMHLIEKGIRDGVSMISTRHAKANNPYMTNYEPNHPTIYIQYLDANNLYGHSLSQKLPFREFRWMYEEELSKWRDIACFLEVSLKYPEHLHDLHNDYPLAPETVKMGKVHKLIPNLNEKEKYVIHQETLKFYLKHGLEITDIHRGIAFQESDWMKPYMDLNTNLRAQAVDDFEKEFFKLINNSVFGKTIENVRNYIDVKLVTNEKQTRKLICKPNFLHSNKLCDNLVAIHMGKTKVVSNKLIYVGMTVLDLSKMLMYKFHYEYIKPMNGGRAKLLFTDTESLMYEIKTDDFSKNISPDVHDRSTMRTVQSM